MPKPKTQLSLFKRLVERDETVGLERNLYRGICLIASFVTIGVVVPTNFVQSLSIWTSLIPGALGLLTLGLYGLSRRGTDLPYVLFAVVTLGLNAVWFVNGGSLGSVAYYMPGIFMLAVLYFAGWWRWVVMGLLVLNFSGLLAIEEALPQLIIPFDHPRDRLIDLATGLPIGGLACALTLWVVLRAYRRDQQQLQQANQELERSLAEIHTLRGLLPVCAWCRKIRNDQGLWRGVDQYLSEHTGARITHSICPDCEREHFPEDGDGDGDGDDEPQKRSIDRG